MNKSFLKGLPYITIIVAGILFIPYSEYYTCRNTCVGNLCTMMYCPPHPLNIATAIGLTNVQVEMPNIGQFVILVMKSVGVAAAVYYGSFIVQKFLPNKTRTKK